MSQLLYRAYAMLGSGLVLSGLPPFFIYTMLSGRYRRHLGERFGCVPLKVRKALTGFPRIWLHAVSLGEVAAAGAIIEALRRTFPGCSVLLSTTTEHGRRSAREILGGEVPVIYGPIDFIASVREAMSRVRPHLLGFLETEIWPAWLVEAKRMGIPTVMVNGRISPRSIQGYLRFRPFFRIAMESIDGFSMISQSDAERIMALGAPPGKVTVNGNAKFDVLSKFTQVASVEATRKALLATLDLDASHSVLVAGSTRAGEEEVLLDVYKKMRRHVSNAVLIIAPRHIRRTADISALMQAHGMGYQLWSDLCAGRAKRTASIVLVDTFGQLFEIYSIATVVFCGGSLVPLGGQNLLEAAAWGKVVLYGPSMEDFHEAKKLLEEVGAGIEVSGPEELARQVINLCRHPERLLHLGGRGKNAVLKNGGAAERHAEVIARHVLP